MSKEIGGVLGKGLRCYLLGADVLEVVSLFSYLGHNSTTAFVQRCQSEIMSALRVLFLRNGYVCMYLCIYIWLVTRDPRDMNSSTCSVMIHCATLSESFLFSGPLFFHLHYNYVGKVISKTLSSNCVLLIIRDQWQHLFYCI